MAFRVRFITNNDDFSQFMGVLNYCPELLSSSTPAEAGVHEMDSCFRRNGIREVDSCLRRNGIREVDSCLRRNGIGIGGVEIKQGLI